MKGLICMKKIIEMLLTVVWALAFAWILFTGKITIEQVLAQEKQFLVFHLSNPMPNNSWFSIPTIPCKTILGFPFQQSHSQQFLVFHSNNPIHNNLWFSIPLHPF